MINLELEDFTIDSLYDILFNIDRKEGENPEFTIECTEESYNKWYREVVERHQHPWMRGTNKQEKIDNPSYVGTNGVEITFKIKDK